MTDRLLFRDLLAASFLFAVCAASPAQDGVVALRGARVLPIDGPVLEQGIVVVAGGRVLAVGGADLAIPDGARVVDCSGKVITPGLVDAGTTLGVQPSDLNEQGDEITPHLRVIDALDPRDPRLLRALRAGVTTIQVNPGNRNVIGGLGAVIKTRGATVERMLIREESGLRLAMGSEPSQGNRAIRGGTPVGMYYRRPTTRMGVVWEARKAFYDAQAQLEQQSLGNGAPNGDVEPGTAVLIRALQGEVIVRTTARAEQDIRTALRLAEEFGYRMLVEEATEAWRVVDEIAAAGVPVLLSAPSRITAAEGADVRFSTLNELAEKNVPFAICSGADAGSLNLIYEAMFAVRHGLPAERALRAVTLDAARLIGVADRVGSISPGRDADLVVWSGDPLDPTSSVEEVWVGGRKVVP